MSALKRAHKLHSPLNAFEGHFMILNSKWGAQDTFPTKWAMSECVSVWLFWNMSNELAFSHQCDTVSKQLNAWMVQNENLISPYSVIWNMMTAFQFAVSTTKMHVHSSVGASKKSMFYFSLYFVFFCFSHVWLWNFHQANSSKSREFLPISAPISSGGVGHGHWDPRTLSELVDLVFSFKLISNVSFWTKKFLSMDALMPEQSIWMNFILSGRTLVWHSWEKNMLF